MGENEHGPKAADWTRQALPQESLSTASASASAPAFPLRSSLHSDRKNNFKGQSYFLHLGEMLMSEALTTGLFFLLSEGSISNIYESWGQCSIQRQTHRDWTAGTGC